MILTSNDKASGFETRLGPLNTLVTVGGYAEKVGDFRPEAHMLAHDGEVFINVRKPTITRVDKPILINGRAEAICDGLLEGFRVTSEGEIEWDTVYPSLPSSPEIIKEVTDSGNVFYKKQIITPEQALQGAHFVRPENKGCIVGYINGKRDNKYQTGKVFQYCRSILYDAKGNTAWTTVEIHPDGRGKWFLVETLPWEWMKRATYPVLKDPILGYSVQGVLSGGIGSVVFHTVPTIADATGGEIISLHAYGGTGSSGGFKLSVANCDQLDRDPEGYSLIAQGVGTISNAKSDILSPTVYAPILPNTWYRVGLAFENNVNIRFDNVTPYNSQRYAKNYAIEMQNPVPVTATEGTFSHVSIWAVYEPVAAGRSRSRQARPLGIKQGFSRTGSQGARNTSVKGGFN